MNVWFFIDCSLEQCMRNCREAWKYLWKILQYVLVKISFSSLKPENFNLPCFKHRIIQGVSNCLLLQQQKFSNKIKNIVGAPAFCRTLHAALFAHHAASTVPGFATMRVARHDGGSRYCVSHRTAVVRGSHNNFIVSSNEVNYLQRKHD